MTAGFADGKYFMMFMRVLFRRETGSVMTAWVTLDHRVIGHRKVFCEVLVQLENKVKEKKMEAQRWAQFKTVMADIVASCWNGKEELVRKVRGVVKKGEKAPVEGADEDLVAGYWLRARKKPCSALLMCEGSNDHKTWDPGRGRMN